MNYFKFYNLEIKFNLDTKELKRQFLLNSKKYHPDFYTLDSENAQEKALELSSYNNEAYNTLSDQNKRIYYILKLKGLVGEGVKNNLPPSFLMEMMDINEQIMELQFDPDTEKKQTLSTEIINMEEKLQTEILPVLDSYSDSASKQEDLQMVLNYYLKTKYIKRIKENLVMRKK
ncbi:MAG: DnaJ domain-containing protein [Saprospiraceae bacterium]|nr:DnaJ domain-containing protein [Saprospiraceae bacterium]